MVKELGKKVWAFAAGRIPFGSNGAEPEFTSHDRISILNTGSDDIEVQLSIFYENETPIHEHQLKLEARRVRKIRLSDLIDPLPIPLDQPYGFVLRASGKVIVQFSRADTRSKSNTGFCVTPYYHE